MNCETLVKYSDYEYFSVNFFIFDLKFILNDPVLQRTLPMRRKQIISTQPTHTGRRASVVLLLNLQTSNNDNQTYSMLVIVNIVHANGYGEIWTQKHKPTHSTIKPGWSCRHMEFESNLLPLYFLFILATQKSTQFNLSNFQRAHAIGSNEQKGLSWNKKATRN